jgi:hypothetical protein
MSTVLVGMGVGCTYKKGVGEKLSWEKGGLCLVLSSFPTSGALLLPNGLKIKQNILGTTQNQLFSSSQGILHSS